MENTCMFIVGKKVGLRPLTDLDFTDAYLAWLNDPCVNAYSNRAAFPVGVEAMKEYALRYQKNPGEGIVLAVIDRNKKAHIGNIALTNIEWVHRCAEVSILIGNKKYWGRGYAREAIYLLSRHAFTKMNLNRVYAGSINPAFVKCVEALGWKKEGILRDAMWAQGKYHHKVMLALLSAEFKRIKEHETPEERV